MGNLLTIGRIFYGIAITVMGAGAIYYHNLPYIVTLPAHFSGPGLTVLAVIWGILFIVAGVCIVFKKWTRQISLLFGSLQLLIFCFYYIPYELLASPNYMHLTDWENAEKELALAGGALAVAGCFAAKNENSFTRFLSKLIPAGAIFFAIPILSFGILHFMYGKDVAGMVPAWIPGHLFWIYFCGAALIGSGIAIILKIKTWLFAALLGLMIFLWFVLLHVPEMIAAPAAAMNDEIISAFLALAYSGAAFVIAGSHTGPKTYSFYLKRGYGA